MNKEGKRLKEIKENNKTKKIVLIILIVFCVAVIGYNAYIFVSWYVDKTRNETEIDEIAVISNVQEVENTEETEYINPPEDKEDDYWDYVNMPFIDVDMEKLISINKETIGYLNVKGTNINYPIVQTSNNDYYISHSFKKESNRAGWIFMDYRNNSEIADKNTIIYGHSRVNGTMFGTLKNILKSDWIKNKENYVVRLSTIKDNTVWQVFSVYSVPEEENDYMTTKFSSDKECNEWIQKRLEKSEYNFNTKVNTDDKVLTLSTCYLDNDHRVIMHAKLIKKDAR